MMYDTDRSGANSMCRLLSENFARKNSFFAQNAGEIDEKELCTGLLSCGRCSASPTLS